jgi:hypothetical protein
MSKPLVVSIPHRLGKAEAVRRLKAGLSSAQADFKHIFTVQEETWVDDSLTFRLSALGQAASGVIDVREDHVQLEVQLPWLLHRIAEKAQGLIQNRGKLLLEKK